MSDTYISDESRKRLLKDVIDIVKNPITDQGIYYVHSDTNMLEGYGMIIGPKDTPYSDGFYFFKFDFPNNYPFSPPKLKSLTQDNHKRIEPTRFNPNLYVDGKVCLSILNTWRGDKWTSCQTIKTILLTLVTVLNENPMLNEPGYTMDKDKLIIDSYKTCISYKNIEVALCGFLLKENIFYDTVTNNIIYDVFYSIAKSHFIDNVQNIKTCIEKYIREHSDIKTYSFENIYRDMIITVDFKYVYEKIKKIELMFQ